MSIEEKAEEALYAALHAIVDIPRPSLREKIWAEAGQRIEQYRAWNAIKLPAPATEPGGNNVTEP